MLKPLIRSAWPMLKQVMPNKLLGGILPNYLVKQIQASLRDFSEHTPILIYQMGKVGSRSVQKFLREETTHLPNPIYHIHTLNPKYLQQEERELIRRGKINSLYSGHLRISKVLHERVNELTRRCFIITGVREPVSRTISAFFQNIRWMYPEIVDAEGEVQESIAHELIQQKVHQFGNHLHLAYYFDSTDFACSWFDDELKQVFDIDVYEVPFDYNKGYVVFEQGHAKVLVYRLEDLDHCLSPALKDFLGLDAPLEPVVANASQHKAYHKAYARAKRRLSFDEDALSRIYSSRYVQHFYDDEMIQKFKHRWSSSANTDIVTSTR